MKQNKLALTALLIAVGLFLTGCEDEDKVSRLPVFDKIVLSSSVAHPGDTLKATLKFSDPGEYVKGTYAFATTPTLAQGQFDCGSSRSSITFDIVVPARDDAEPEEDNNGQTYTLVVTPIRMSAFAGYSPYIDPSEMGSVSTTFRVE